MAAAAAALLGSALALPALAQNVAIVNGKPVPKTRLDALSNQVKLQAERLGRPVPEEVQTQLRQELIAREIFTQEAERRGLQAQPKYRANLELARQSALASALFEEFLAQNPVTEAEARAEYERVVAAEMPAEGAKEYHARHILVETEDEAKNLIDQLKKGAKFDELAKKHSKDPGSGSRGGDLGWADPKDYVGEFSSALTALEKGKTTQAPVKSEFGYHIIRLEDVRPAPAPDLPAFELVKSQITRQLEQQKLAEYQKSLQDKAKVE